MILLLYIQIIHLIWLQKQILEVLPPGKYLIIHNPGHLSGGEEARAAQMKEIEKFRNDHPENEVKLVTLTPNFFKAEATIQLFTGEDDHGKEAYSIYFGNQKL